MTRASAKVGPPSYGIDAPRLLAIPALLIVLGIVEGVLDGQPWPFVGAALVALCAGFGLYASRRGKFVVWSGVLDELDLRGDERVLDLGCGRGAILMLVARRLSTGRAVGIDLWRRADQSGNSLARTRANAVAEGVADRVELETGDMTKLPFRDASFDLVVSNLAVHNVKTQPGRDRAIDDAVRVLRPGGRLLIADIRATDEYRNRLESLAVTELECRNLGWRMWWSGPWLATRLVTAAKP